MKFWLRLAQAIDRLSEAVGRAVLWLSLIMVLIGAFNALARSLSRVTEHNFASNAFIETQWYLFSAIFMLGAAYTLKHDGHVRVDVLYSRLSARARAWINLLGTTVFLLPFCILMIWVSWPAVINSWSVWEQSPDPGGLPRYPVKTLVPLAFTLLIAQGIAETIKHIAFLSGDSSLTAQPGQIQGDGL